MPPKAFVEPQRACGSCVQGGRCAACLPLSLCWVMLSRLMPPAPFLLSPLQVPKDPIGTVSQTLRPAAYLLCPALLGAACANLRCCVTISQSCRLCHPPSAQFVMFHGCFHDSSGSWPYDPQNCPECLGLPEEVAHVKQALK